MSTDLLDEWKTQRFIRVADDIANIKCVHLIVLTDTNFWNTNYEALKDWCDENDSQTLGMTVEIANDRAYTLFCLRWG
jgi:hypothetical protein